MEYIINLVVIRSYVDLTLSAILNALAIALNSDSVGLS